MYETLYVVALSLLVIAFVPALLQWLWNMTVPDVFGLSAIDYWQSFRLMLIAQLLVGAPLLSFN